MGASNAVVMRMLVTQAVVGGLVGYGLGLGVAALTGLAFDRVGLAFRMTWHIPAAGAVALLARFLAAGLFGMAKVLKLEPGIVFKA